MKLTFAIEVSLFALSHLTGAASDDVGLAIEFESANPETDYNSAIASAPAWVEVEDEDEHSPTLRGVRHVQERLFNDNAAAGPADTLEEIEVDEHGPGNFRDDPHELKRQYPNLKPAPVNAAVVDDEFLVVLEESINHVEQKMAVLLEEVNVLLPTKQAEGFGSLWEINDAFKGQAVKMTHAQAEAMSNMEGVKYIERNIELPDVGSTPANEGEGQDTANSGCLDDLEVQGTRWNLDRLDQGNGKKLLDGNYNPTHTGDGVLAIIVDDGIDGGHKDFLDQGKNRVITEVDSITGKESLVPSFQKDCGNNEDVGHGTFVAAIVGGKDSGVAKKVNLVDIRRKPCKKGGGIAKPSFYIDVFKHIYSLKAPGRKIVVNGNIQIDVDLVDDALTNAFTNMIGAGIVFVVAAGDDTNREGECPHFPANLEETITVGAIQLDQDAAKPKDELFAKTDIRCDVDVFAPGANIKSAKKKSRVEFECNPGGTAYAAAHVSGVVALLLEEYPKLDNTQVKNKLIENSKEKVIDNIPVNILQAR